MGADRPGFKVELVMDVLGISTFSDGFSYNATAHSAEERKTGIGKFYLDMVFLMHSKLCMD